MNLIINLIKRYKFIVFIITLFLFAAADSNLLMLCFQVLFQVICAISILGSYRLYLKTGNGNHVQGRSIALRKIPGIEEDVHNYEHTVQFPWPNEFKVYEIKHKFSSLSSPAANKVYGIWINEENPAESLVTDHFGEYWLYSLVFFAFVFLGLFIADYMLIKMIFSE